MPTTVDGLRTTNSNGNQNLAASATLNFTGPNMTSILATLITNEQRLKLQVRLVRSLAKGKTLRERIMALKVMTSGRLVQCGTHCLSHNVYDAVIAASQKRANEEDSARKKIYNKKKDRKLKAYNYRQQEFNTLANDEMMFLIRYKGRRGDEK